jgi:ribosome-binding factor A
VVRLIGAVAGVEAELVKALDDAEQVVKRLLGKKLVAEADPRIMSFVLQRNARQGARLDRLSRRRRA